MEPPTCSSSWTCIDPGARSKSPTAAPQWTSPPACASSPTFTFTGSCWTPHRLCRRLNRGSMRRQCSRLCSSRSTKKTGTGATPGGGGGGGRRTRRSSSIGRRTGQERETGNAGEQNFLHLGASFARVRLPRIQSGKSCASFWARSASMRAACTSRNASMTCAGGYFLELHLGDLNARPVMVEGLH